MIDAETREWLRSRPAEVHTLLLAFPPGCRVKSAKGRGHMIPAPDEEAVVVSYFENGNLGVVPAPDALVPLPIKAEAKATELEFVAEGPISQAEVREALG